jgi:uncharacterized protein (TIGR02996 family)
MPRRPQKPKADAVPYPPGWEPFLAAINANLDDNTPRLVFADWLQENGDEDRAEFIRIQCELASVHPKWEYLDVQKRLFTPHHHAANERQKQLRIANFDRWVGSFPKWAKPTTLSFRRGFAHYFAPTALQWLKDGEHVRRQSATEQLTIAHTNSRACKPWRELFTSSTLVGLKLIELTDLDSDGARMLANSPALDSLSALGFGKLGKWEICAETSSALVSSPRLTKLRKLWVTSNYIGDAVATALVSSPHIPELEELQLLCTALGSKGFVALLASPKLDRLRRFNVQGNGLGDSDIRALVQSRLLSLEELNLRYNGLTAESARLLAAWPGLRSIRVLQLAGAQFGPDGVREFLASEFLTNIEELELPRQDIRQRDKIQIAALPAYQRIPHIGFAS